MAPLSSADPALTPYGPSHRAETAWSVRGMRLRRLVFAFRNPAPVLRSPPKVGTPESSLAATRRRTRGQYRAWESHGLGSCSEERAGSSRRVLRSSSGVDQQG
ncbi:uncharacterized protein LOC113901827 [Bos indicus x Bos taurus]|uniref:uncharacterized protein LOC113901827 n=1 Tax=Bos indicus x Bos taurus TaxID=30522 RepID=UPI000F7D1AFF|nr:uncharacterized protein LOC113901827 [Bos indicus x Bos taurus]